MFHVKRDIYCGLFEETAIVVYTKYVMGKVLVGIGFILLVFVAIYFYMSQTASEKEMNTTSSVSESVDQESAMQKTDFEVFSPSHASFGFELGGIVFYNDPVNAGLFEESADPDIVLLSDIHGDHLNIEALEGVVGEATIIAPQAVADELPEGLKSNLVVLGNGETSEQKGVMIEAIPMYNVPESDDAYHVRGRGNGYVLEDKEGKRVYIAGDTGNIEEMRSLEDIDVAFVPMNLPYTMTVEDAADAVLAFAPKTVYPYHYRGSDTEKFKQLVNEKNSDIDVVLLDWYSE